jgi:endonuclease YncB( thermonuclease family)
MKLIRTLPILFLLAMVGACTPFSGSSALPSLTPADLNTQYTDALKLNQPFSGKNFIEDGIGEVTLRSTTDGDTARFNVGNVNIAVRFLGINTPESTGKIQPWGNAASAFTANILTTANRIVLINDVDLFGQKDSSGSRYLGFIWYQPAAGGDFRLLNLEIVEQAFSESLLFNDSPLVPYFESFQAAGQYAQRTKARIYGFRNDPNFDYSDNVYDVSIRFVRKAFGSTIPLEDKEGKVILDENDESTLFTLTNSTKLRLQVVVVATIGSNAILRDVFNPDEQGDYASMFLFTQFSDLPFRQPGDVIQLYAKATSFNNNVQLTDPIMQTFHPFYPLTLLTRPSNPNHETYLSQNGMSGEYLPFDMRTTVINDREDFATYNGFFVQARIVVRARPTSPDDDLTGDVTLGDFFRKDANNNMTIYSYYAGTEVSFNLRIDGRLFPYIRETNFAIGATYDISGYIAPYFDNYQLQIHNGVVITPVTA